MLVIAALPVLLGAAPVPRARTRSASVERVPVLLVHGFNGSGANWTALVQALEHAGWQADEIDAMNYDSTKSNKAIAQQIADEVAALKARTGASRVDVVSHSMGAISTRWYLEHLGGTASVAAWASLAGVNEGTVWAYGCYLLTPCKEMTPSSTVLDDLARHLDTSGATRYATWWSPCDEAVVPQSNAKLPGARNTETACLGHSAVKSDPTVLGQVVDWLGGAKT
jgi:triacylglycerol lipase